MTPFRRKTETVGFRFPNTGRNRTCAVEHYPAEYQVVCGVWRPESNGRVTSDAGDRAVSKGAGSALAQDRLCFIRIGSIVIVQNQTRQQSAGTLAADPALHDQTLCLATALWPERQHGYVARHFLHRGDQIIQTRGRVDDRYRPPLAG